jgi:hypothetical protein
LSCPTGRRPAAFRAPALKVLYFLESLDSALIRPRPGF